MIGMDEFVIYLFLSSTAALGGWSMGRYHSSSRGPLGALSSSVQVLCSWVKIKGPEKMVKSLFTGQVCHHFSVVVVASKLPQSTNTLQVKETFKC